MAAVTNQSSDLSNILTPKNTPAAAKALSNKKNKVNSNKKPGKTETPLATPKQAKKTPGKANTPGNVKPKTPSNFNTPGKPKTPGKANTPGNLKPKTPVNAKRNRRSNNLRKIEDVDASSDDDDSDEIGDDEGVNMNISSVDKKIVLEKEDNDDDDDDDDDNESDDEEEAEKGKKRKVTDDSDDEPSSKKKKAERDTRPRSDKQAKLTDDRTILVDNVCLGVKKKTMLKLFSGFGQIENLRFRSVLVNDATKPKVIAGKKKDFNPDRYNYQCVVTFVEQRSAEKALSMNGKEMKGLTLKVNMATREPQNEAKLSVFIGQLPIDLEEKAIIKHFKDCGEIESIRLIRDRKTGQSRGFGFVNFIDADAVSSAKKLDLSELGGRNIRVEEYQGKLKTDRKAPRKPQNEKKKNESEETATSRPKAEKVKKTRNRNKKEKKNSE